MSIIRRIFNIQPGEEKNTFLFFLYFFAIISAIIVGKTARDVFFLARFNPAFLPYIFIISALCVAATTILYIRIAQNKNQYVFSMITGGLLASSLLIINVFLNEWIYPVLYVWIDIITAIIVPQFWLLTNTRFTSRQAKRLFGPIGAAAAFANIIIGFSIQNFITTLGTDLLLPIASAFLFISLLLLYAIKSCSARDYSTQRYPKKERKNAGVSIFNVIQNHRYIGLLSVIVILSTITVSLIEYQFKIIASQTYSENQLAAFFGMLYGIVGLASGFIQIFFISRILRKFGVLIGLLILPVFLGVSSLFLTLSPIIIYALMARLSDLILRYSIHDTTMQILWLPVSSKLKQIVKPFIDGTIKNSAQGFAGLLILLVISLIGLHFINILIILLIVIWIICSVLLKKGYLDELKKSVGKRDLNLESFNINITDSYLVDLFKKTLISGNQNQKIFIINEIKNLSPEPWTKELKALFTDGSVEIRREILAFSHNDRHIIPDSTILNLINSVSDPMRTDGMIIAAKRKLKNATDLIKNCINDSDFDIRASANVALILLDADNISNAEERLNSMLDGTDTMLQISALKALTNSLELIKNERLKQFITSDNLKLSHLAITIAGEKQDEKLLPSIVSTLKNIETRKTSRNALQQFIPHKVEKMILEKLQNNKYCVNNNAVGLMETLGDLGSDASIKILPNIIDKSEDDLLLDTAVDSCRIIASRIMPQSLDSHDIEKIFECRVKHAYKKLHCIHLIHSLDGCILLKDIFQTGFNREIIRLLNILDILYPDKLINTYIHWFLSDDKAAIANVVEIIESNFPAEIIQNFIPLIDDLPLVEKISSGSSFIDPDIKSMDDILIKMIDSKEQLKSALAIDAIINNNLTHMLNYINWQKALENPYIKEVIQKEYQSGQSILKNTVQPLLHNSDKMEEKSMYTTLDKTIILKGVNLFSGLTGEEVFQLAQIATEERFLKDEEVFQEGDPGDSMYSIIDGSVSVFNQKKEIAILKTGECFGEMALFDQEPRSSSIRAVTDTAVLKIDEESFYELIAGNIEIIQGVVKVLSKRLRKLISQ